MLLVERQLSVSALIRTCDFKRLLEFFLLTRISGLKVQSFVEISVKLMLTMIPTVQNAHIRKWGRKIQTHLQIRTYVFRGPRAFILKRKIPRKENFEKIFINISHSGKYIHGITYDTRTNMCGCVEKVEKIMDAAYIISLSLVLWEIAGEKKKHYNNKLCIILNRYNVLEICMVTWDALSWVPCRNLGWEHMLAVFICF